MTVGADHIALLDLSQHSSQWMPAHLGQRFHLLSAHVIEVHYVRRLEAQGSDQALAREAWLERAQQRVLRGDGAALR
jgi:hypothetical protein